MPPNSFSFGGSINSSSEIAGTALPLTGPPSKSSNPWAGMPVGDFWDWHQLEGPNGGRPYGDVATINDAGEIAGDLYAIARAVVWRNLDSRAKLLPLASGYNDSVAVGLDAAGDVAGWENCFDRRGRACPTRPGRAVVWLADGERAYLPSAEGDEPDIYSVAASRAGREVYVVGEALSGGWQRAAFWTVRPREGAPLP